MAKRIPATHDPYGPLLGELQDCNDCCELEDFKETLRLTQPHVKELRNAYRTSPSNVDYSDKYKRGAYLLAYYPHYIEPVCLVLREMNRDDLVGVFSKSELSACFLGAGPAPEVLGWITFLGDSFPEVVKAHAYVLDKNSLGWYKGLEITRYHLAPLYWPNRRLVIHPQDFDLMRIPGHVNQLEEFAYRAIGRSRFFAMQNCLNDLLGSSDVLLRNLLLLITFLPEDSIFVIIDLGLSAIKNFLIEMENRVEAEGLGRVLLSASRGLSQYDSGIQTPEIITRFLLTGDDGLIPRRKIKFFSTVILRTYEFDPLPF